MDIKIWFFSTLSPSTFQRLSLSTWCRLNSWCERATPMEGSAILIAFLTVAVLLGDASAIGPEASTSVGRDGQPQVLQKESAMQVCHSVIRVVWYFLWWIVHKRSLFLFSCKLKMPCAQGWFEDAMHKVGWNLLSIVTSPDCSDEDQVSGCREFLQAFIAKIWLIWRVMWITNSFRPTLLDSLKDPSRL